MTDAATSDFEVLVLAPFGKDAGLIESVLRDSGLEVRIIGTAPDLVNAIPDHAGCAIAAEEALLFANIPELARKIEKQPPWSDFPVIVLTGGGISTADTEFVAHARAPLGNVTLLERPLRPATLISAVRSALAARKRQYEVRDHLRERQLAEEALRSARDALESIVEERTAALRRLSAELLRVQDDERRRIARELHDSLGQYLAAAKINLDTLAFTREDREECFSEVQQLIDRAITETRTLSHLLHPPLLDATGFASAASWYVEGFGKRSGIAASLKLPENLGRLSVRLETALFRIMQEALTNVHRHSGSRRVDIVLKTDHRKAVLVIRDFGKGIPKDVLERFKQSGTNVGVGLAGIRERVKELGGNFNIHSNGKGTTLEVSIPIADRAQNVYTAGSGSQIYSSLAG
jgi:signal transduction histidine kinase